jgi:ApbE superfamily uncharacterized protein (UPF0280 family)
LIVMSPQDKTGPIQVLAENLILVDWGPMTMTLAVWDKGVARPVMAVQAAWSALKSLQSMADFQGFLRLKVQDLPRSRPLPRVVRRAFDAARRVSGELTSLASVAGATADEVADTASDLGADRVIVNNGGDIALRLRRDEEANVGVRESASGELLGKLLVRGSQGVGGVATSGWSGRSYSPGVADLVTVWARNASLADAAATFIAGRTTTPGFGVRQARASTLDPSSDLGDTLVTVGVEKLSGTQRRHALREGAKAAESLRRRGKIFGCLIYVQGDSFLLDPERITSLRNHAVKDDQS